MVKKKSTGEHETKVLWLWLPQFVIVECISKLVQWDLECRKTVGKHNVAASELQSSIRNFIQGGEWRRKST